MSDGQTAGAGQFCSRCHAWLGSLGLEPTPELYVEHIVEVFREVRRVLRDDGTLWLNMGDSYASIGRSGRKESPGVGAKQEMPPVPRDVVWQAGGGSNFSWTLPGGIKPKDLVGIPWMVALALRSDGWWLRSDIIWHKPNCMPESVRDRPTKSHEYVFLLAKSKRYYYDQDAIREPYLTNDGSTSQVCGFRETPPGQGVHTGRAKLRTEFYKHAGRNKRTVWTIPTHPFPEAHFACVDDATEALTPSGWRYHDELRDGDLIAAYDVYQRWITWQRATFHRYPFKGELVAIEKRDSSQRLTLNHRCLIKRRDGSIDVVVAGSAKPSMSILQSARFSCPSISIGGEAWAALVGWYITEGEDRYPGMIRLYQSESANPQHIKRIRHLLHEVRATYKEHRRDRQWHGREAIEIQWAVSGEVANRLQSLAAHKAMTPSLTTLPLAEAQALLDALIDGDGHRREGERGCIVQKDKGSIDLMQLLAMRLGHRAIVSPRAGGCYTLFITNKKWLTLRSTNGKHQPLERVHYEGVVWCPSVQSHFWVARRDGKPFITGNTFPPKLVEPMIKAGTSERGRCPECGKAWVRIRALVERHRAGGSPGVPKDARGTFKYHQGSSHSDRPGLTQSTYDTVGWQPACSCNAGDPIPCIVLDPFSGAATTLMVAERLGRDWLGIDINPGYCEMSWERIKGDRKKRAQLKLF